MDARGVKIIGVTGSHRVGKTTLAQAFAERYEIPFVKTSSSEVFKIINRDPAKDYPIEERIAIQESLLYAFECQFAEAAKNSEVWISDRTPIDLASYLLADVSRGCMAGSTGLAAMVTDYVDRCIRRTNQFFSAIVLVQPGIPLVPEWGKAPCCPAYIEHLNFIQAGILLDEAVSPAAFKIPRRVTSLQDRLDCAHNAVERTIDRAAKGAEERKATGIPIH